MLQFKKTFVLDRNPSNYEIVLKSVLSPSRESATDFLDFFCSVQCIEPKSKIEL